MLLWIFFALQTGNAAFAQSNFQEEYLDKKIERFLSFNQTAYARFRSNDERSAQVDADYLKLRETVQEYSDAHPGVRLASCRFYYRGSYQFHFNGRRSKMLDEQQRMLQEAVQGSIDPLTLAIFAGKASPVVHKATGTALDGDKEEQTWDLFKAFWRENIIILYDRLNEVKEVRVATRQFKRWNVSKAELTKFLTEELRIDVVEMERAGKFRWIDKSVVPGAAGNYFDVKSGPAEDPVVDLNIFYSLVNFECSDQPPYKGGDNIQIGFVGVPTSRIPVLDKNGAPVLDEQGKPKSSSGGGSQILYTTLDDLPNKYPQIKDGMMLTELLKALKKDIADDEEFQEIRQQIEEQTKCGVTLDIEIRKAEQEFGRDPPYSNSVGFRTSVVVQGWYDPTVYRIFHAYDIEPFQFRDIRNGQRGMGPRKQYIDKMLWLLDKETEAKTFCTRPTRSHVDL